MRLLELLTEASVFDPKYLPGTEFLLGSGAAAEELNIKAKELGIDLSDVIKKAAGTNNIQGKTIQHGKGTDTVNFFDSKGQEFTVTGTKGKISTSFVKNIANRGEVAEGILGAAMFSKFTKRVGNAVEIGRAHV